MTEIKFREILEEVLDEKLEEKLDKKLEENLSGIKTDISGLKADVEVLKTDVSELKADVEVLKTDVSDLKERMSVNEERIQRLGVIIENDIRHPLQLLCENLYPTSKGWIENEHRLSTVEEDVKAIKIIVKQHSESLRELQQA